MLAAYVGETVTIRYNPRDLAELRVYHDDAFLCRAVCQELADRTISLKEIARARRERRAQLGKELTRRSATVMAVLPPPPTPPRPRELSPEPTGRPA